MPDISIAINDAQVRALLNRAPNEINAAIRGAAEDASTFILARLRHYPPQRAGSSYKRTGTLSRSWSRRVSGSGLSIQAVIGSAGTIAPYNRVVMDSTRQAPIHRGRWQTVQSVAQEEENTVQRMFADRIRAAMGGL